KLKNIDRIWVNTFLNKEIFISAKIISKEMNISLYKANKILTELINENILVELNKKKKSKVYILVGIMEIITQLQKS
ncbi:MAG: hypothetical protein ACRC63_02825, partial [Metamycoplasmataceae bacterium]